MTMRKFSGIYWGLVAALVAGLQPESASAQANLTTIIDNASAETYAGPGLVLSVVTFVVGAAVVMWGVIKLKEFTDGQVPLRDGLWRIGGGSLLMALPFVVNVLMVTLYGGYQDGTEGDYSATLAGLPSGSCENGLDQCMVIFMQSVYEPFLILVNVACYILGGICIAVGIYRMAQAGTGARGQAPSTNGTVGYIVGGAILISLGEFMDVIRNSIFGDTNLTFATLAFSTTNPLPTQIQTDANAVFTALFAWVQLIGWLAFARGVYLLIKISQGNSQRSHGHAFTHIICGCIAVNMYPMIQAIQSSLGINLVT